MQIPQKSEAGHHYTTYELLSREPWGYKKSRVDLKAIIMFCVQQGIEFSGFFVGEENAEKLFSGNIHPHELFGRYQPSFQQFHVEDYVSYGFPNDKDPDEIMDVIHHYCGWLGLNELENPQRSYVFDFMRFDLTKYDLEKNQIPEDFLSEQNKERVRKNKSQTENSV